MITVIIMTIGGGGGCGCDGHDNDNDEGRKIYNSNTFISLL
jgi:hypothetical protein